MTLERSTSKPTGLIAALAAVLVIAAIAAVAALQRSSANAAPAIEHGRVVDELPRGDFPQILDGKVFSIDQVGSRLIVGGTFTTIRADDGMLIKQPNVAAFYLDSGSFDASFRPEVDGRVQAVEAGPGNSVYLGGKFKTVDGQNRTRLVKYDLDSMEVDGNFRANANKVVRDIEYAAGRLFVGGNFTQIRGVTRLRLAELHPDTGSVQMMDIPVEGDRGVGGRADGFVYSGAGALVQELDVTPDGSTLVVMHRGDTVGGLQRWGAAMIDISGAAATVLPWQTDFWPAEYFVGTTDAELSPDGSYFVVVSQIGNFPPHHDTAVAFPVEGGAGVEPLWVTQFFDSVYAVAVSDAAVYVGGHFCWTEGSQAPVAPLAWPGDSGNHLSCDVDGAGAYEPATVRRDQIAALDPATGLALDWNPGSNAFNGVRTLEVTNRGLFLGHDGERVGGRQTGRLAVFDLGAPPDTEPPTATHLRPESNGVEGETVSLMGRASDDSGIESVTVALRDRQNGRWLRNDGTWGDWEPLDVQVEGIGTRTADWSLDLELPDGAYALKVRGEDLAGNQHPLVTRQFIVETFVDSLAPSVDSISLANGTIVPAETPVVVAGMAHDNVEVDRMVITIRDVDTREFLQPDGTWGSFAPLSNLTFTPAPDAAWSFDVNLGPGNYQMRAVAKDAAKNTSLAQYVLFTIEEPVELPD